ncbi:MAG: hypothetical protein HOI49_10585 [Bacteroidetes bacterium]|jgi:hypothetical protein|nr:hypothetical protein [Bacteroidota bacterium]
MKKQFNLFLLLVLGAGMMTIQSCSEDEGNDPEPEVEEQVITCLPTTVTESEEGNTITINYEYDANDVLVKSTKEEDGEARLSTYEYDADGMLSKVITEDETAEFLYAAGSTTPERINISTNGQPSSFIVISSSAGNITKIENSYYDNGEAILSDVTNFTYVDNKLNSSISESYDPTTETFVTVAQISDITFDGKKNPFNSNIAFAFDGDIDPLAITPENIASGNIVTVVGTEEVTLPYTGTYTYNENDYPITSRQSLANFFNTDYTYEYTCK